MTRSSFVAAAAVGLAVASLADAQPAAGLAPLSPQIPAGLAIPDLPANAPRTLVRAVEAAKANPSSLPAYAPALIKAATTAYTPPTKEEHKAGWAKAEAEWKAAHPNGYKGMDKAGRRLAGAKHAVVDEAGEAVALKMKKGKAAIDGEAVMKHAKATKVVTVGEAVLGGGKHHKGRLLLGGKHAVVDEAGKAIVIVKAKKAHKTAVVGEAGKAIVIVKAKKAHKTAVVGEAALGKHKGRLLLGGKHAVDGEAGEALLTPVIKAPKVHKVKLAKIKKVKVVVPAEADVKIVKAKKVKVYAEADAEAGLIGKKHNKGRKLAGHKGAVDEAGEAIVGKVHKVKATKMVFVSEAGEAFGKHGKMHG